MAEAPCEWPIDTGCCTQWDTYPPEMQANATAWATEILWALTGRRYGVCTTTVRPCGSGCTHGGWMTYPVDLYGSGEETGIVNPFNWAGTWYNHGCTGPCACRARCQVALPGPVDTITSVSVDGLIVDPTAYRVDNHQFLVRTDGDCWPRCQNFDTSDPMAESTFFVTYTRGTPVPLGGQIAAGMLACDFANSCTTGCNLPGNLSSLSRQGVEIAMVDPTEALGDGLTGVHAVDQWIRSVNPYRLMSRSRVRSIDSPLPVVETS